MLASRLLDWLLPPRCGSCGLLGAWLCFACREQVRYLREPLCRGCGRELEFAGQSCGCRRHLRSLSGLLPGVAYEGPVEKAIQRAKYQGWKVLVPSLADLLLDRLAVEAPPPGAVQAVPLHARRERARGFNQAELIAHEVRCRYRRPPPQGRLIRVRDTPSQVGLDRSQRRVSVAGAFAWKGPDLRGRPILLVDDVATTGATLEACAAALRQGGAGTVIALVLARAML